LTPEMVKDISAEVFKTLIIVSGPMLMVSLLVGLLVSFFQAITQIQEFTLTFVPKILAVFAVIFIFMPWLARVMMNFTITLFEKIPQYVR
jgi:flagellar biosynthetic protein FliQ